MPVITAGVGQASVGRDCTLVLVGPFGRIELPNVTGFDSRQEVNEVHSDRLDAKQLHASIPKGWSGSFELDRGSPGVDDFFALQETAWYLAGTITSSTLYQYIQEADGTQSTYQYDGVALRFEDAGRWQSDNFVKQKIAFRANRRRKV